MKAIVRHAYGSPDVLSLVDLPAPVPGGDQVLVRVRAASLNAVDMDFLLGRPAIARIGTGLRRPRDPRLGVDVAGVVEAVGEAVTGLRPGDEVFGDLYAHGLGAFAELVCAPERAFVRKPPDVPFEIAATLPQAGLLALQGLRGGREIRPGERVLINGASGNVGPFAVQIAKASGAEVTGVCRGEKADFVRSLGADHVIDYTREDYTRAGRRYDRILDVAGHRSMLAVRRALRPGGRYVMAGGDGRRIVEALVVGPVVSLAGSRKVGLLLSWKPGDPAGLAELLALLEAGRIAPAIDRRYPLAEVPEAMRYLASGQARGKVVITT